jgi:hypothetical protein
MAFLVCFLLIASPRELPATLPWGGLDFVQYYAACELLHEGKNPYDHALELGRNGLATSLASRGFSWKDG